MSRKGLYPFVASQFIVVDTLVYFMFQDSDNGIAIHPWLGPSKLTGKLKSGLGCASNLNPFEYFYSIILKSIIKNKDDNIHK